ncbi:alpha-tectorin-like [Colossoma macropomum]|uniref:alpha-tectorin-like n=1 Tax=Colossoma macropomum TaxID=42526 RepID=UPI001864DC03|nr:alpha-tectorin-like [Colossoma macropomum]
MGYLLPLCLTVLLCMSGVVKPQSHGNFEMFFPISPEAVELTVNNGDSVEVQLHRPFLYFGKRNSKLYFARDGFLTFFQPLLKDANPNPHIAKDIIAPLWTDIEANTGGIFYEEATSGLLLQLATSKINKMFPGLNFSASWIFLGTWVYVHFGHDAGEASFQVVLISDDNDESYILMNYGGIPSTDQVWLAGYSARNKDDFVAVPVQNITELSSGSNVKIRGRWAFKVQNEYDENCEKLHCTKKEVCVERSGFYGCDCSETHTRPRAETFDASEICESSSGSLSLSRCQLFEAGYPAELLHLNDDRCKGKIQGDQVVFGFDNDDNICGTILKRNETHIIYENSVQFFGKGGKGVISREKWLNVTFSCVYPLIQSISMPMAIEAKKGVVSKELSTEGSYEIHMLPFPNASFIEPYFGNVTLDVNQQMFVAVVVDGVDKRQIALVLDSCWATPVNDMNNSHRWPLIVHECPSANDSTVEVLQNGISTVSSFSFRMFTFTGQPESIYLHCKVHLCLLVGGDCAQRCDDEGERRTTKRPLDFHDTTAITMSF